MTNKKINHEKYLANFLYEVGSLRKVIRSHRQTLLIDDLSDNIASHSYRVAIIGYFLASEERLDIQKVLTMCIFHDVTEARSGDQNWVNKKYVKVFEEEITKDQLKNLPGKVKLKKILDEYEKRESRESKAAKDADRLDQIFLIKEHAWQGNNEAASWTLKPHLEKLVTKTAKKLAREIIKTKPTNWWHDSWTQKRR